MTTRDAPASDRTSSAATPSAEAGGLTTAKRALLQQRLRGQAVPAGGSRRVARRATSGPAPLAAAQEQLWYYSQIAPDNPVYNEAITIRKDGPLDLDAFRCAFNEIVRRHEIWHSTFELFDGAPMQVVRPAPTYELPLVDLSATSAAEREREAAQMAAKLARQPYDLAAGPLLRPLLVRFDEHHHRLYVAMHHLIFDGVTLYRVVLPELVAAYDAFVAGGSTPLPEPELQYADYAVWEREWIEGAEITGRLAHWRRRLADAPALQLPLDHARPAQQRFTGAMEPVHISTELADGLRSLSRQSGATLFQVLATAFTVLLYRYTGQDDLVFGTAADLRGRPELESLVGYCLTPMLVRANVDGTRSFVELLEQVRSEILDGLTQLVPFERLIRELHPRRDPGITPFLQAMVVLEPPMVAADPSWSIHQMETEMGNAVGHAKFDVHLELDERPDGHISGRWVYNTDLFDAAFGPRVARHWLTMLESIVAAPEQAVGQLPLLRQHEVRELVEQPAIGLDQPTACVHELVEAQAASAPEAVAVVFEGIHLTYGELNARANQLAHELRARGVGPETLVAVCMERSEDMVVSLLGILKAGGAYVPMDLEHPAERIAFMLADTRAPILLTYERLLDRLPAHDAEVVCLDRDWPAIAHHPTANPTHTATPANLAYVIYTSGSTGTPKGVMIEHANVVRLFSATRHWFAFSENDVWTVFHSYAFDFSVWELWGALVSGGRAVVVPLDVARSPERFRDLLASERVTILNQTPSAFRGLAPAMLGDKHSDYALSTIIFGGETLDPGELGAWFERFGDRHPRLVNMYGITETTVFVTYRPMSVDDVDSSSRSPIGRTIPDLQVYVLDANRQPVPTGVRGELYVGGAGVARGYLARPELTADRFVPDPFSSDPGARLYRSGDLVRYRSDGDLEYLGRSDDQVKIRGYRIELGEIEATLVRHPAVAGAMVLVRADDPERDQRLVAYVVPRQSGHVLSAADLRRFLKRTLAEYMVPAAFVSLGTFPLTPNGKVDRRALPEPLGDRPELAQAHTLPRTPTEAALAAIWADVLKVDRVGLHDNFFELGGHSLLAVRMLVNVERQLGEKITVAALFDAGMTVAGLAHIMRARSDKLQPGSKLVIPLAEPSATHTLFFVNPGESSALTMRHLPGPLRPDYQVVGLLPQGAGGRFDRAHRIEDLAKPMLESIREAQASGPYYLAGFSLGALLAYEIAGRLREAGEAVGWLGVLDAAPPMQINAVESVRGRLRRTLHRDMRTNLRMCNAFFRPRLTELLARLGVRAPATGEDFDVLGALQLTRRYPCRGHDAPMDVFVTQESVAHFASPSLGWENVHRGELRIRPASGDHLSMVEQPHVAVLAAALARSLRRARDSRE